MKTVSEMREGATEAAKGAVTVARKAAYAAVGAPVVAGRKMREAAGRWTGSARKEIEAWVEEGEQITATLRERHVVEELKEKVDFDQLQGRVERLRDQLEEVLANWRETFLPHGATSEEAATEAADEEKAAAAPKRTTATRTTAKTAAKRTTAKTTTAKRTPAKKAPAEAAARKTKSGADAGK